MATYTIIQNQKTKIEVTFYPGLPKIEILGANQKSVKDAAIKAKLLLQREGLKFPKNRKIYVHLHPGPTKVDDKGFELAIYHALRQRLLANENTNSRETFYYGSLYLDGKVGGSEANKEIIEKIAPGTQYYVCFEDGPLEKSKHLTKRSDTIEILWNEEESPILWALVYYKEPLIILNSDKPFTRSLLDSLKKLYFFLHQEEALIFDDLHLKSEKTLLSILKEPTYLGTMQACPCKDLIAFQRKTCALPKTKCSSYRAKALLFKKSLVHLNESSYDMKRLQSLDNFRESNFADWLKASDKTVEKIWKNLVYYQKTLF